MLKEFLRTGPPPSGGPSSILHQSLVVFHGQYLRLLQRDGVVGLSVCSLCAWRPLMWWNSVSYVLQILPSIRIWFHQKQHMWLHILQSLSYMLGQPVYPSPPDLLAAPTTAVECLRA